MPHGLFQASTEWTWNRRPNWQCDIKGPPLPEYKKLTRQQCCFIVQTDGVFYSGRSYLPSDFHFKQHVLLRLWEDLPWSMGLYLEFLPPPPQRSCGKVMFSQVSVCHSVHRVVGTAYASWDRSQGRVALPFPPSPHWISDLGTYPPLLTSGGYHWRPVRTCSLEDQPPPPTSTYIWWWSPKHVRLASRRYASYWSGVLLQVFFVVPEAMR